MNWTSTSLKTKSYLQLKRLTGINPVDYNYNVITNDILMAGKFQLTPSLTFLFNKILVSGIYPDNWSRGYISPIFKSGDRSKPGNYRGIAITGCLSKSLNSLLNSRLQFVFN